jgi:hypothetical protein
MHQVASQVWRGISAGVGLLLFIGVAIVAVWDSYANTASLSAALCFLLAGFLFWIFWFPPQQPNQSRSAWTVLMLLLVVGGAAVLVAH